jgi:hypothetical protein
VTISPVGFLAGVSSTGITSFQTFQNNLPGDLWVLCVIVKDSATTATGVSGTNTNNWVNVTGNWLDGTGTANESIWIGQVHSFGTDTINVTFSGSVASIGIDLVATPFRSNLPTPCWAVDAFGHQSNASSTTVAFPTLTPTIDPTDGEMYWGHARVPSSASTPTPAGFTAANDPNGNPEIYGIANASVSPTMTQAAGISNTIAILFSDQSSSPPPLAPLVVPRRNVGPMALRRRTVAFIGQPAGGVVQVSSSDVSVGVDTGAAPPATLSSSDVETAVDGSSIAASLSSSDVEVGVEGTPKIGVSSSDVEVSVDSGSIVNSVSSSDVSVGVDSANPPPATLSNSDLEAAVETGRVAATLSSSDLEVSVDGGTVLVTLSSSDLEVSFDAASIPTATLFSSDVSTGIEGSSIAATLSSSDLEVSVDRGTLPYFPNPKRTWVIPATNRTYTVTKPNRTFTVAPENRTIEA